MMMLIFSILMAVVFGKILVLALKAAWSGMRILLTIFVLPFILIGLACTGMIFIAIVLVVICGIVTWMVSALV
jgi:hypothetical protein